MWQLKLDPKTMANSDLKLHLASLQIHLKSLTDDHAKRRVSKAIVLVEAEVERRKIL